MQEQELKSLLQAHNIPLSEWGVGEAKTFNHLLGEIQSGEAAIHEENGNLIRSTRGAVLMVFYIDGEYTWYLEEDRQVFKDGREKRRDLGTSIGEKMKPGETTIDTAYRALEEELNISEKLELTPKPQIIKGPVPSQSYPGLMSSYVMDAFDVFLPKHLYKPEGYIEEQEDKTNYYVWVKAENS